MKSALSGLKKDAEVNAERGESGEISKKKNACFWVSQRNCSARGRWSCVWGGDDTLLYSVLVYLLQAGATEGRRTFFLGQAFSDGA